MRARTLAAFAALACTSLAGAGGAAASTACPGDERTPSVATEAQTAAALVCDINVLRAENGLGPLRWDFRLWSAAQAHADDMARHHFLGHEGSDGSALLDRLTAVGYAGGSISVIGSENVDWGSATKSSPLSTAFGWMNSGTHRDNLLDRDVEDLGVGVAQGDYSTTATDGTFYVVDFGARSVKPARTSSCARTARRRYRHRTRTHARRIHRQRCRA